MSRAAAEVGSTANSYQILAKLATGGMAEIFLARGESVAGVERYCVLKRILRHKASDVHFVRMFLDEARLAAQLQHPNIAQVYDIGKLGDSYFFTMEYVHGETVRALLHRAQGLRRTLPVNCILTIAAGAAAGLHHAHERMGLDGRALGIVHRDVSPSNLMVSYEGGVKVVDFGVAKAADRVSDTRSGTVKGKISYLSPEQCKGRPLDRRSDLFSLGICLWEMLTTERLYKRSSDFENMNAIVTEQTPPPSARRPEIPREVDQIALKLLAKSPDDRFQTAEQVVEALEEVSVRTGSVISTSALGRLLKELFGQRPEPWLELETHQEHGEAVTVTSEPIPKELAIPVAAEVDLQLQGVVDLSSPIGSGEAHVPSQVITAPVLAQARVTALGFPLAAPPPTHPGPVAPTAQTYPAIPPPPPTRSATQSIVQPPSGPHVAPAVAAPVVTPPPPPAIRRLWPLIAVVSGAAVLGVLAMLIVMRTGDNDLDRPQHAAILPADAAIVTMAVVPPEPDAAPPPPPTIPTIAPLDAGAPPVEAVHEAPRPRPPPPPPKPRDEIAHAFDLAHYSDAVTACGTGPLSTEHALMCVIAACHLQNETKAKKFLAAVPVGRRDKLIATCRQYGLELAKKKPPKEDCDADPLACQH